MKFSKRRYIDSNMTFFAVINIVTTGERYIKKESTSLSIEFVGEWVFCDGRCALFLDWKYFCTKAIQEVLSWVVIELFVCPFFPYCIIIWKLPWHETQIISYSRRYCYFLALTIDGNGKMCTNCDLERGIASRGM